MKEIQNESFTYFFDEDSSATFEDIEFRNCSFENCYISQNTSPLSRTLVRNVNLIDCVSKNCDTGTAILENIIINNLRTPGLIKISGSVFNRVVLKGKIGQIMIKNKVSSMYDDDEADAFLKENKDYYSKIDWALDISDAEFIECDIRDIPSELIKRDPKTQKVVYRKKVEGINLKKIKLNRRYFLIAIQNMLEFGYDDTVLVAPKQAKDFSELLEDLQLLDELGITDSV